MVAGRFLFFYIFLPSYTMSDISDTSAIVDDISDDNADEVVDLVVDDTNEDNAADDSNIESDQPNNEVETIDTGEVLSSLQPEPSRREKGFAKVYKDLVDEDGEIDDVKFEELYESNEKTAKRFLKRYNDKEGTSFTLDDFVDTDVPHQSDKVESFIFAQEKKEATQKLDALIDKYQAKDSWSPFVEPFKARVSEFRAKGYDLAEATEMSFKLEVAPNFTAQTEKTKQKVENRKSIELDGQPETKKKGFDLNKILTAEEYQKTFNDRLDNPKVRALRDKYDAMREKKGEPYTRG